MPISEPRLPRYSPVLAVPVVLTLFLSLLPYVASDTTVSAWRVLARTAGPVALVLFALNFLLATRAQWVNKLTGGLDKTYTLHHMSGGIAFIVMLLHPVFLALDALPNGSLALSYIIPQLPNPSSATFYMSGGITSLYLTAILLILTFYIRLPYQIWKLTHTGMGLVFFPLTVHLLFNPSLLHRNPLLYAWLLAWICIGSASYIYRRFLYSRLANHARFSVSEIIRLPDAQTLHISLSPLPEQPPFLWQPGQYGFFKVQAPNLPSEKHPFSFTTAPEQGVLGFAFKELGDYTRSLSQALQPSTEITVYGPYGGLGDVFVGSNKPAVLVAGGIGITPFLSLLEHEKLHPKSQRQVHLIYSVKNLQEAVFLPRLKSITSTLPHVTVHVHDTSTTGFLTFEHIHTYTTHTNAHFFLCGPAAMMTSLKNQAAAERIPNHNIIFEAFELYEGK